MTVRMLFAVGVLSFVAPAVAGAQGSATPFSIQAAGGLQLNGGGHNRSISAGVAFGRRIELLLSGERIHLPTTVTRFEDGQSVTRHGTVEFISGELRLSPFAFARLSPYLLVGAGRGTSRPNVNEFFPDPVSNDAILLIAGGGLRVPLTDHLSVVADMRFVMLGEDSDDGGVFLFAPVRGGLAWRF
jgi:hypothetical protein